MLSPTSSRARPSQRQIQKGPVPVFRDYSIDWDAPCKVCNKVECTKNNDIVFCDACNVAYHMLCHQPPILRDELKEKNWFCSPCRLRYRGIRELDSAGLAARWGGIESDFSASTASDNDEDISSLPSSDDEHSAPKTRSGASFTRIATLLTSSHDQKKKGRASIAPSQDPSLLLTQTSKLISNLSLSSLTNSSLPPSLPSHLSYLSPLSSFSSLSSPLPLSLPHQHAPQKSSLESEFLSHKALHIASLIRTGFPVCLTGIGSKRRLLRHIADCHLHDSLCLEIHGLDPETDLREVFSSLASSKLLLKPPSPLSSSPLSSSPLLSSPSPSLLPGERLRAKGKTPRTPFEAIQLVRKQLDLPKALPLTLLLHNVEGPVFQATGALDALWDLSRRSKVRILASADGRDFIVRTGGQWVVEEVHTWVDYREEMVEEGGGGLPEWLSFKESGVGGSVLTTRKLSVVLLSLTMAHKRLVSRFARLAAENSVREGKERNEWRGLNKEETLQVARVCGSVTSVQGLDRLMLELVEHNVFYKGSGGLIRLPEGLTVEELCQLMLPNDLQIVKGLLEKEGGEAENGTV